MVAHWPVDWVMVYVTPLEIKISTGGNHTVVVPVVYVEVDVTASAVCHLVMSLGSGMAAILWARRRNTKTWSILVVAKAVATVGGW